MTVALATFTTPAAALEACRALVDEATRRANDALESAIRRQSIPAEFAAYRMEADALDLEAALCWLEEAALCWLEEAALCWLEDAPPAWWEQHAHLTPTALLAAMVDDRAADVREEEAGHDR